jgi:hypothetical protein
MKGPASFNQRGQFISVATGICQGNELLALSLGIYAVAAAQRLSGYGDRFCAFAQESFRFDVSILDAHWKRLFTPVVLRG